MLVLRAMVSMVEETVWTWFIAEAKPAMRSPSWTTRSVRPLKPAMVPSIASRPASSLALACSDSSRASSVESRDPRLVGEQPGGHFLEPVEHLQMLADALGDACDVAGDVAAFDRQRSAIARHRADRVFGDFLDAQRGHVVSPIRRTVAEDVSGQPPTSFVNHGAVDWPATRHVRLWATPCSSPSSRRCGKAGIPASLKEHLLLLEALDAEVIAAEPEQFYYLARVDLRARRGPCSTASTGCSARCSRA